MEYLTHFFAEEEAKGLVCQCEPCRKKKAKLDVDQPKKRYKRIARSLAHTNLVSFGRHWAHADRQNPRGRQPLNWAPCRQTEQGETAT